MRVRIVFGVMLSILCISAYANPSHCYSIQIQAGKNDISDYIKLLRELGYECSVRGVFNEEYDIKIKSEMVSFSAQDPLKTWVNEKVIPRVIAREEISL